MLLHTTHDISMKILKYTVKLLKLVTKILTYMAQIINAKDIRTCLAQINILRNCLTHQCCNSSNASYDAKLSLLQKNAKKTIAAFFDQYYTNLSDIIMIPRNGLRRDLISCSPHNQILFREPFSLDAPQPLN
uniref:Uncharacterized protein n=1 Tax=Cacopsylla melanoneura TaxID=428564 RepID=A0A8D9ABZ0_9HEMI